MNTYVNFHPLPFEDGVYNLSALIFQACRFDCLDLIEFECIKMFGHDQLTRLSEDEGNSLALACRQRIARRAHRLGYLPNRYLS